MRRSAYAVAGVIGLALIGQVVIYAAATASPTPGPGIARALAAIKAGDVSVSRDSAGKVHYVTTHRGHPMSSANKSIGAGTPAAQAHLTDFAPLFGVKNPAKDLTIAGTISTPSGSVIRFQQTHNGLPVIGGQLVVSDNTSGALVAINGEAGDVDGVSTSATVTPAEAAAIATSATSKVTRVSGLRASKPTLSVLDPAVLGVPGEAGARTVYRMTVTDPGARKVNRYVLVDANTGTVTLSFSQNATLLADGVQPTGKVTKPVKKKTVKQTLAVPVTRTVCDFNNHVYPDGDPTCPSDDVATVSNPDANPGSDAADAYDLTGAVNDFYNTQLGRAGIDGHNMDLVSSTRFCPDASDCFYANAFWNGTQMVFGDSYAGADDVVGHELTHGVTQNTSGLLYYYQSGAINESISDVIGELFDQYNTGAGAAVPSGNDDSDALWELGEDLPGWPIGLRSMSDPGSSASGAQPDSMTSPNWDPEPFDNGGVHTDSGVGNKAAYLMVAGGTLNSVTVTGIATNAIQKVGAVWLGAEQLLTPGSVYVDLANALNQSCQNLLTAGTDGMVAADCTTVANAINAVKMTSTPTEGAIPQAFQCGGGYSPVTTFSDTFDRTAGDVLGTAWTQTGSPYISYDAAPNATAAGSMLIPDPFPDTSAVTRYAYTTNWIKLSSAHTNYLYFQHLDSFDWTPSNGSGTPEYYDGGFVDIDVNGDGKSWIPISGTTGTWTNGPTKSIDQVSGTTLTGTKTGFGGDSRGWTSSRATLATALKGKQIKVRFSETTDGVNADSSAYGWFVDNVAVNDCVKAPLAPTTVVAKGYDTKVTMTWGASSTNGGTAIKNYAVYVDLVGDGIASARTTLASSARTYTWTGLARGKDYIFKIRSLNSDGAYSPYVQLQLNGANLSITASPTTVASGGTSTISGVLTQSNNAAPLTTRKITLYSRKHGTTTWTASTTQATTTSTGAYTFSVNPTSTMDYYVQYSTGSPTSMGTSSATVTVTVS